MSNEYIRKRLEGIRNQLMSAHSANCDLSNASKGREREEFVNLFLSQVFAPHYRFSSGDITDQNGNLSGQLDIVIEYPFLPSLPLVGVPSCRLFMAEGVATVIEVKSDLRIQWSELLKTLEKLNKLKRKRGVLGYAPPYIEGAKVGPMSLDGNLDLRIPLFAVGYTGWKTTATIQKKINEAQSKGNLKGILVIDKGLFCSHGGNPIKGSFSLWGLINQIHQETRVFTMAATPALYCDELTTKQK